MSIHAISINECPRFTALKQTFQNCIFSLILSPFSLWYVVIRVFHCISDSFVQSICIVFVFIVYITFVFVFSLDCIFSPSFLLVLFLVCYCQIVHILSISFYLNRTARSIFIWDLLDDVYVTATSKQAHPSISIVFHWKLDWIGLHRIVILFAL